VIGHEQREISVVETAGNRVVARVPLESADFGRLRFAPDGRRVVLVQGRRMMLFDPAARKLVDSVELPYTAKVIDISPTGDRAVISHPGDSRVTIVSLATLKVLAAITTGKGPDGVAWPR
jgi:DNA-binding beta-propeller fold protein YncE